MCTRNHLASILVAAGILMPLCAGCQQESATGPAAAAKRTLSPEESFEQIAKFFTRSVQTGAGGVDGGFLVREDDGHSRLAIRNEVTHELIPPSKEGEPFRGVITVTSQRDYAIQRIGGGDGSDDISDEADESTRRRQSASGSGVDILDRDLVTAPANERRSDPGQSKDLIARLSDEDVRHYELEYENNRWVLKTELDPNTERAIEHAFDHALSYQQ